jgi:L-ascorbate metabolism protein UlaG (beta-lactamase superfamily)
MDMLRNIRWFGHASFSVKDENKQAYFLDPFDIKDATGRADIIFISHLHSDHFSPGDIMKIMKEDTAIVSVPGGAETLGLKNKIVLAEPGRTYSVKGLRIHCVPAYNIKPGRLNFHPRSNKWVGYILHTENGKVYHAGDTDYIPEMDALAGEKLAVAMLPMGGTYTMDVGEAIQAANAIKAEITIPMHYRRLLGAKYRDAEKKFIAGVKGRVAVMEDLGEGHH